MKVVVKLTEVETKGLKDTIIATELIEAEKVNEAFDEELINFAPISKFNKSKSDGEYSDIIEVDIDEKAVEIVLNAATKIAKFVKPIVDIVNLAIKQYDNLILSTKQRLQDLANGKNE